MKYVVNAGGVVHSVADETVEMLIHERGMRLADSAETEAHLRAQGLDSDGRAHPEALKEREDAVERQRLAAAVTFSNAGPTEPYVALSSDSPLAKVREAKRQRALSVEATLTPTAPFDAHNQNLQAQIDRNHFLIDEANIANAEAVKTFDIPTDRPSATDQDAWLGSADPKVETPKVKGKGKAYSEASALPADSSLTNAGTEG